jgi:serine/threonine protein kinase/tetratricopeptide (TPR) repeat protein
MLPPNYKIDQRYEVIKELGSGMSGEVYLVRDADGLKALKFLKKLQMGVSREDALRNFKNEFTILKELNHPGIGRIIDFGVEQKLNRYFYTTEFIPGAELHKVCEGQPFDVIERLLIEILRALNYLHTRGVYHFDIKPQNILVGLVNEQPTSAKIIDFGLSSYTPLKQKAGTATYMAPEIISGNHMDGRADLYSFGVMVYRLLTDVSPFHGNSLKDIFENHLTLIPPLMRTLKPEIPEYWEHVVARLMQKNPDDRYAQAALIIRDLNFLSGKQFAIETDDTKFSYLPEKGALIGRESEWKTITKRFTELFTNLTESRESPKGQLMIIAGAKGTGKTRLLAEIKHDAQLKGLPVLTLAEYDSMEPPEHFVLTVDDNTGEHKNRINALAQLLAQNHCLILWATEKPPTNWQSVSLLTLENYKLPELKCYLETVTGLADMPQDLVEQIYQRTNGNPFFVTEFVKALIQNNSLLDAKTGHWTANTFRDIKIDFDALHIPNSIEESLIQDYRTLSDERQCVLKLLALHQEPLTQAQLLQATNLSESELLPTLTWLVKNGFLEYQGLRFTYSLRNRLMAEVIGKSLDKDHAAHLHDRLAHSLSQTAGDANHVLFHYGYGSDLKTALPALITLGDRQTTALNPQKAAENFRKALSLAPLTNRQQRSSIADKLGKALMDANLIVEALALCEEQLLEIEVANEANTDAKLDCLDRMLRLNLNRQALTEADILLEQAKNLIPHSTNTRIFELLFLNHEAAIAFKNGKLDTAETIYTQTQMIWENELNLEQKMRVTNNELHMVHLNKRAYEADIAHVEKLIATVTQWDDKPWLARLYFDLAQSYGAYMSQMHQQADRQMTRTLVDYFDKAEKYARAINNYKLISRIFNALGNFFLNQQDNAKALDYYERGLSLAQKYEPNFAAILAYNLSIMYKKLDRTNDAYSCLIYTLNTLQSLSTNAPTVLIGLFNAHMEIAEIHLSRCHFSSAHESVNKADAIATTQTTLNLPIFWVHLMRAKVYFGKGKKTDGRKSLALAQSLVSHADERSELEMYLETLSVSDIREPDGRQESPLKLH